VNEPELLVRREEEWTPLTKSEPNEGFRELQEATFHAPDAPGSRLLVDDELLPPTESGKWSWKPGFVAGPVRAELLEPSGRKLGTWTLRVSPDPRKAPGGTFERMIEDILAQNPALLVGAESSRKKLGALHREDDPFVALERLRQREEGLLRAIAATRREPRSVLRSRREFVPLHRVRRSDPRTLAMAVREPAVIGAIRNREINGQPFLSVPAAERSLDSPANRAALLMVRALRRRASETLRQLKDKVKAEDQASARTTLAGKLPRWAEILGRMERTFSRAERASPFRDAKRPEITAAGLNAVAAHPLYSQFWRLGWEALWRGVSRDVKDELPLSPTWEIYERWCYVELSRHLAQRLSGWEKREGGKGDHRKTRFLGPDGAKVTLFLQKATGSTGLRSVSASAKPDLVLRWKTPFGAGFVVLDAKYRAAKSGILGGMRESSHFYQDALRWDGSRPEATLLLVPDAGEAADLADESFVSENRIGIAALRPGTDPPAWFVSLFDPKITSSPRPGILRSSATPRPCN